MTNSKINFRNQVTAFVGAVLMTVTCLAVAVPAPARALTFPAAATAR